MDQQLSPSFSLMQLLLHSETFGWELGRCFFLAPRQPFSLYVPSPPRSLACFFSFRGGWNSGAWLVMARNLVVEVISARDLMPKDGQGSANAYCVVWRNSSLFEPATSCRSRLSTISVSRKGLFWKPAEIERWSCWGDGVGRVCLIAGLWRTTEQDQDCPQESQPNVEREGKDQHPSSLHGYLA
jgi:hypothetical protein